MKINNILNLLNDGGSATFASVQAVVSQSMIKTNKETGEINSLWYAKEGITKRTTYQVSLNCIYQNMVNNQREREGKEKDFKAKPNWFEPVFDSENGSIVCNKNNKDDYYLKVAVRSAQTSEYFIEGRTGTIWIEGIEKINGKPV